MGHKIILSFAFKNEIERDFTILTAEFGIIGLRAIKFAKEWAFQSQVLKRVEFMVWIIMETEKVLTFSRLGTHAESIWQLFCQRTVWASKWILCSYV